MAIGNPRVTLGAEQGFEVFFDDIVKELKEIRDCITRKIPGAINYAAIRAIDKLKKRDLAKLTKHPDFPVKTGAYRSAVRVNVRTSNPNKARRGGQRDEFWGARTTASVTTNKTDTGGFVSRGKRWGLHPNFEKLVERVLVTNDEQALALFQKEFDKIWEKEVDKCYAALDKVKTKRVQL